ncbi:hypothetical protein D3C84_993520 [compost metagenome]
MSDKNQAILDRVQKAALAACDVLDAALADDTLKIEKKCVVAANTLNQYVRLHNAMNNESKPEAPERETLATEPVQIFKLLG